MKIDKILLKKNDINNIKITIINILLDIHYINKVLNIFT